MIKVLNMQEKETLNCSILEAAVIKLVSIPLIRNLSCTTLTQNLNGIQKKYLSSNKASSYILRTWAADASPSRKCRSGH